MYTLSDGKNVGFFFDSVRNFLEWITGKIDTPMSTVDDGVRGVAVLEAILKSARERKPVQVQDL
jgi:predicted dehydrogenase